MTIDLLEFSIGTAVLVLDLFTAGKQLVIDNLLRSCPNAKVTQFYFRHHPFADMAIALHHH